MDDGIDLQRSGRRDTYKINIGEDKQVEFRLDEGIFKLQSASKRDHTHDKKCVVCAIKMGKADTNHCQFCGHKACKKCAYKMRMYANQADKVQENQMLKMNSVKMQKTFRMGKVCRICDRKFFMRASIEGYANEIEFFEEQAERLE